MAGGKPDKPFYYFHPHTHLCERQGAPLAALHLISPLFSDVTVFCQVCQNTVTSLQMRLGVGATGTKPLTALSSTWNKTTKHSVLTPGQNPDVVSEYKLCGFFSLHTSWETL